MTTPTLGCSDKPGLCHSLEQEHPATHQTIPDQQSKRMATSNVDSAWATVHNMSDYGENFDLMLNDQSNMSWSLSHDPAETFPQNTNYQLDPAPEYLDNTSYHGGATWQLRPQLSSLYSSLPDPGCPRTFPALDCISPMLMPYATTISPHQIYYNGPPRSEPYPYGEESEAYGSQRTICESVEPGSPVPTESQFAICGHPDDNASARYHSTPYYSHDDNMGDDEGNEQKQEPYAKSLYRCLRDAPGNTMVLKDIYDWYKQNTMKGKEPHEKGWQNSIRHNLSMNKAFEKIEVASPEDPNKKGFQWRLSEQAIRDGRVQSTTRYRNKQPNKRGSKSHNPAPHRQASGAKGGRMARYAAEARRSERLREARQIQHESHRNLRSMGIIRSDLPPMGRTGLASHSPSIVGMDYTSGDGDQSGASSPYDLLDDGLYDHRYAPPRYEPAFPGMHLMGLQAPPGTPYATSPDGITSPEIPWGPMGEKIFYESSEPQSEPMTPHTPSSYSDMSMDVSAFSLENY